MLATNFSCVNHTSNEVNESASPVGANRVINGRKFIFFLPHIQHFLTSISGLSLLILAASQFKPHNSEILKLLTAVANLILKPQNYYYNLLYLLLWLSSDTKPILYYTKEKLQRQIYFLAASKLHIETSIFNICLRLFQVYHYQI